MSRNIFRPGGTAVRWLGIAWRFPSSLQDESLSVVVLQPLRSWLISSVAPRLQSQRPERRGNALCLSLDCSMTVRPIQSQIFRCGSERFSFSLGEKVGMRASVKLTFPPLQFCDHVPPTFHFGAAGAAGAAEYAAPVGA